MSRRIAWITRWTFLFGLALAVSSKAQFFHVGLGPGAVHQRFHRGDLATNATQIHISCAGFGITDGNNVRVRIPPSVNMTYNTGLMPGLSTSPANQVNTPAAPGVNDPWQDGSKTLFLNANINFSPGNTIDVTSNLQFMNFNTVSAPASLEFSTNGGTIWTSDALGGTVRIADVPQAAFSADQTLAPGLTIPMSTMTIQESSVVGNGGIWSTTGIRLTIPQIAGLNHITWSGTPTCGGSAVAGGRMSASPAFNLAGDGGRTAFIAVSGPEFSANDTVTISGLNFLVSSSCPDVLGGFQVGVRTGPASNTTLHKLDANSKFVLGLPTISSAANQVFTTGDPSTQAQDITIRNTSGTTKITNANNIRITIPASFNMTWDTSINSITVLAAAAPSAHTKVDTNLIMPYEDGGRTAVIDVTADWGASGGVGEGAIIRGLRFANFGLTETPDFLLLDTTNDGVAEDADNTTIAIGTPTILSLSNQVFQTFPPGPANVSAAVLRVRDNNLVARIGIAADRVSTLRVTIPALFPMTFQNITTVGVTLPQKINTGVSYSPDFKTLILTANTNFNLNEAVDISGLGFTVGAAASSPDNLGLFMSATGTLTDADNSIIAIGGVAQIASTASQTFTTFDPSTQAADIQINDADGVASITLANNLRITIPVGFNMRWDQTVTNVTILPPASGPSAQAKVAAALIIPYEDGGRTAVLDVTANFAINEGFIVRGLRFTNFTDASDQAHLEVRVTAGGPAADADPQFIAIGKPVISQPASLTFGTNDASTLYGPITITDDINNPRITDTNEVRIRIPTGINMTWDSSVTNVTITWNSPGLSKVSGALILPYEDSGKTAVLNVTTPFVGGDSFTVNGLRVLPGATETGTSPLELEVNNIVAASTANATTGLQTIRTNNRPTISSATTQDTDGNGSIDRLVVAFSEPIDPLTPSAMTGSGFTLSGYLIANGTPGLPNASSITYRLVESGLPDTGVVTSLTYDPLAGTLLDLQGLETSSTASSVSDSSAPVIVGFSGIDSDGNGRLNTIVVTFSENLVLGQEDLNDWVLIDANGTTNLLAGLTNASFVITNGSGVGTLTITLTNTDGTAGVPRFQYSSDGLGGRLRDSAGNFVPFQTNNTTPIASAGPDQTLAPTKVTLNGAGSIDPDGQPVTYRWTPVNALATTITLSSDSVPNPTFLARTAGAYQFQLQVSDSLSSSTDTVQINILNVPPIARPLFDQVQNTGDPSSIFGFFSSDINGDPLTYLWTQLNSPPAPAAPPVLPTSISPSFTPPAAGVYEYSLAVTDTAANTNTSTIRVRVHSGLNMVPTAHAGPDRTVAVGSPVVLDGRMSSTPLPVNGLNYSWTSPFLGVPATTPTVTFTPSFPGTTVFQLIVTDAVTGVPSAASTVTINAFPLNRPPVAVATKLTPVLHPIIGQLVTLDSVGSIDPEGSAISYAWLQTAGPSVQLSSLSTARPTFTAVAPGTYEFQLLVTDGSNWSLPSKVRFPILPNATYATPSIVPSIVTAPLSNGHISNAAPIFLAAVRSGTFTDWWWEQIGGPAVVLNNTTGFDPTFPADADPINFTALAAGVYTFRATIGDFSTGVLAESTIDVIVDSPAVNIAPTADAGAGPTNPPPAGETITLNGIATDAAPGPAGPFTAFWTQLTGAPVTLNNADTLQPSFVPPVAGTYIFQLNVSDGAATSGPDLVVVTVGPANQTLTGGGSSGGCGLGAESLLFLVMLLAARRALRQ